MENTPLSPELLDMVKSIKDLTRETLLFQSHAAMRIGLNPTDGECLDFLMEKKDMKAGELAKLTRLTTGAITSVIDRLEKSGFVKREKVALDRRMVIVRYLPGKEKEAAAIYGALAKDVIKKLGNYQKEELEKLGEFTQSLLEIYKNNTSKISTNLLPPSPARNEKDYYDFIFKLVKRTQGKVKYWQNDCEPNNPVYWAGSQQEFIDQTKVFYQV